jgi:hypothetical protein
MAAATRQNDNVNAARFNFATGDGAPPAGKGLRGSMLQWLVMRI